MTSKPDRHRRQGGVLVALVLAIVAAWLVFLWLDGSGTTVSEGAFLALVQAI